MMEEPPADVSVDVKVEEEVEMEVGGGRSSVLL